MKSKIKFLIVIITVFAVSFLSWHYYIENLLLHNTILRDKSSVNTLKVLQKYFNLKTPELNGGQEWINRTSYHNVIDDTFNANKEEVSSNIESKKHLFYAGHPDIKKVALTFDDGPDILFTTKILDILKNNNIKATFFVVGNRAQAHPDMVKRIMAEGHIIGNHTWDHPVVSKLSKDKIIEEILKTENLIYNITGYHTTLFRPPYGKSNTGVIGEVANLGYNIIDWSVDTRDWAGTPPSKIMEYVRSEMRPGGIILQHCAGGKEENLTNTVVVLQSIINLLKSEGYGFVQVPELLNIPSYRQ